MKTKWIETRALFLCQCSGCCSTCSPCIPGLVWSSSLLSSVTGGADHGNFKSCRAAKRTRKLILLPSHTRRRARQVCRHSILRCFRVLPGHPNSTGWPIGALGRATGSASASLLVTGSECSADWCRQTFQRCVTPWWIMHLQPEPVRQDPADPRRQGLCRCSRKLRRRARNSSEKGSCICHVAAIGASLKIHPSR